jgi:hypothetical protein
MQFTLRARCRKHDLTHKRFREIRLVRTFCVQLCLSNNFAIAIIQPSKEGLSFVEQALFIHNLLMASNTR